LIKDFIDNNGALIVIISCLVEIAPIKINPLSCIFKWIGAKVNAEIKKDIDNLRDELGELRDDVEHTRVDNMRWNIRTFTSACRGGVTYTQEEWEYVITQCKEYEDYVGKKEIPNGVIDEEMKYIRELYQENIRNDTFL
jgi:hypothetical protein